MLSQTITFAVNNLRAIVRDRTLSSVLGVALFILLMVPSLSTFSMRQVQEIAISLSLSTVSLVMLVSTLLLGASSIWRDIERRYTASVLTLTVTRSSYLLGKFLGIALFLVFCTVILGCCSALMIMLAANSYPSDKPIVWGNIVLVLCGGILKCLILTGFALLLSAVSTSFYLPFFGTLAIYFCGSASQEVFEYVSTEFGQGVHPFASKLVSLAYYVLPNFAAFNFQVQAVYGLPIDPSEILLVSLYACIYTGILLGVAVFALERRQLP